MAGKHIPDEDIKAAWDSFLVEIPDYKLEMVLDLRKRFQVFMLSNTNAIHFADAIPKAFEKHGKSIDDYFDHCYLSYRMKASKPNPLIFDLLINDSGINPCEALFIDDSPENIRVARELGFQTYLAMPYEDFSHLFEAL
jgi:glucose-1-phosphatase